jgi:hypothetical protein
MAILAQQHDTATLLEAIAMSRRSVDHALQVGRLDLVRAYCDAGLADISTYRMCRNQGLEEPYCSLQSADSFVTDMEAYLQTYANVTDADLTP